MCTVPNSYVYASAVIGTVCLYSKHNMDHEANQLVHIPGCPAVAAKQPQLP